MLKLATRKAPAIFHITIMRRLERNKRQEYYGASHKHAAVPGCGRHIKLWAAAFTESGGRGLSSVDRSAAVKKLFSGNQT